MICHYFIPSSDLSCFFVSLLEATTNISVFKHALYLPSFLISFYLIPSALVSRHVPFKQSAVREAAAAFRAAEGLLGLLVAVPDVLL